MRGYSGLLLGELLMSACLLALLARPRWSLAVGLALATALSAYFHLYAAIVVVVVQGPFLVAMLVWRRADPTIRRGAILGWRHWLPSPVRLLAWGPAAIGAASLLWSWAGVFADFQVDEGFRDGVRALESNAPEGTALCAIGAGAELFQWYASKPLPLPKTVNELQQVGRRASEVRCIGRPASWESRSNAELRRYVEERSTMETYSDIVVYRLRRGQ